MRRWLALPFQELPRRARRLPSKSVRILLPRNLMVASLLRQRSRRGTLRILFMMKGLALATLSVALMPALGAAQRQNTPPPQPATPPRADTTQPAPLRLTLDDAIRIAVEHDHALAAARTT